MTDDVYSVAYEKNAAIGLINSWLRAVFMAYSAAWFTHYFRDFSDATLLVLTLLCSSSMLFLLWRRNIFQASAFKIELTSKSLTLPALLIRHHNIDLENVHSAERLHSNGREIGLLIGKKDQKNFLLEKKFFANASDYGEMSGRLEFLVGAGNTPESLQAWKQFALTRKKEVIALLGIFSFFIGCYVVSAASANYLHITDAFLEAGGNRKGLFSDGEYYRLFTAFFLHIGILHLLINLTVLSLYGHLLIRAIGIYRFITILLVAAFFGAVASNVFSAYQSSVGASGGIYGLIGAFIHIKTRYKDFLPGSLNPVTTRYMTGLLLFDLAMSVFVFNNVDVINHVCGFLSGYAFCRLARIKLIAGNPPGLHEKVGCVFMAALYIGNLLFFLSLFYGAG